VDRTQARPARKSNPQNQWSSWAFQ
jgi:hypothetical protein